MQSGHMLLTTFTYMYKLMIYVHASAHTCMHMGMATMTSKNILPYYTIVGNFGEVFNLAIWRNW